MVSATEPNQEKGWKAHLLVVAVIAASVLFILTSAAPTVQTAMAQPSTASNGYQPEPSMNTNITWSTFHSGWNPLEYSNGSTNQTLNAEESNVYANPISLNPTDIQANGTLTYNRMGTQTEYWDNTSILPGAPTTAGGQVATTSDTSGHIALTVNTSNAGAYAVGISTYPVFLSEFPSNNIQYDYLTAIIGFSGPQLSGAFAHFEVANATAISNKPTYLIPGQVAYFSENLLQIEQQDNYSATFNTSGKGLTSSIALLETLNTPQSATNDVFTLTIYAMAFTEYPLTLGQNSTGNTINSFKGNALKLTTFDPSFTYQSVSNEGYTVSVSQSMQNTTIQKNSINDGSFTEQATYQGIFSLPTAPDLSYSTSNISIPLTTPGTQYEVANLNGASYLSAIQARTNGTFSFGTVNPNAQNSLVLEMKFTTAQWDASSSPPSFFSLAGLEYYWWATLIAIMSFVGLGSAALSHFGADEEGLRIPKGKFGR